MKFANPNALWALFALAIPIIVHFYHFKKHRTFYFSSLFFVKKIEEAQKTTSKLKHLLLLIFRLLAFLGVILAFAKPYFPAVNKQNKGQRIISIYVDNSFSMSARGTEGELLPSAKDQARQFIKKAHPNQLFFVNTNHLNGIEQHLHNKTQALNYLEKIDYSSARKSIQEVIAWQNRQLQKIDAENTKIGAIDFIYFSDFQKINSSSTPTLSYPTEKYHFIQSRAEKKNNLSIDSLWFSTPSYTINSTNVLNIRIKNQSDEKIENAVVQLDINTQKRELFASIEANKDTICQFEYRDSKPGMKKGIVKINDQQLFWDDVFYFNYEVKSQLNILVIDAMQNQNHLVDILKLEASFNTLLVDQSRLTFNQIVGKDMIFLNGITEISEGLKEQLLVHTHQGGGIFILPGNTNSPASINTFLNALKLPVIGNQLTEGNWINTIQYRDAFFEGVFQERKKNIRIPVSQKIYRTKGYSNCMPLIGLQNGQNLMVKSTLYPTCFLFTGIIDENSDFIKQALYPSIMLRSAFLGQKKPPLFAVIGKNTKYPLYELKPSEDPIKLKSQDIEIIPSFTSNSFQTTLLLNNIEYMFNFKANHYDIDQKGNIGCISINYDRSESEMTFYEPEALQEELRSLGIENFKISQQNPSQLLADINSSKPFPYWKYFIVFSLIFVITEMVLIKIWKA